jgi:hypothetical protein
MWIVAIIGWEAMECCHSNLQSNVAKMYMYVTMGTASSSYRSLSNDVTFCGLPGAWAFWMKIWRWASVMSYSKDRQTPLAHCEHTWRCWIRSLNFSSNLVSLRETWNPKFINYTLKGIHNSVNTFFDKKTTKPHAMLGGANALTSLLTIKDDERYREAIKLEFMRVTLMQ